VALGHRPAARADAAPDAAGGSADCGTGWRCGRRNARAAGARSRCRRAVCLARLAPASWGRHRRRSFAHRAAAPALLGLVLGQPGWLPLTGRRTVFRAAQRSGFGAGGGFGAAPRVAASLAAAAGGPRQRGKKPLPNPAACPGARQSITVLAALGPPRRPACYARPLGQRRPRASASNADAVGRGRGRRHAITRAAKDWGGVHCTGRALAGAGTTDRGGVAVEAWACRAPRLWIDLDQPILSASLPATPSAWRRVPPSSNLRASMAPPPWSVRAPAFMAHDRTLESDSWRSATTVRQYACLRPARPAPARPGVRRAAVRRNKVRCCGAYGPRARTRGGCAIFRRGPLPPAARGSRRSYPRIWRPPAPDVQRAAMRILFPRRPVDPSRTLGAFAAPGLTRARWACAWCVCCSHDLDARVSVPARLVFPTPALGRAASTALFLDLFADSRLDLVGSRRSPESTASATFLAWCGRARADAPRRVATRSAWATTRAGPSRAHGRSRSKFAGLVTRARYVLS
jgi:hypothetical protein